MELVASGGLCSTSTYCCSRKATPSGMAIAKRIRSDIAPTEKIVSEADEQLKKLVETQMKKRIDIGKH